MARPKGALNKRTRAALHAAQTGELGGGGIDPIAYLLKVMRDSRKPDALRIEAAKAVAPFLAPKLAAVEVISPVPGVNLSKEEMLEKLGKVLHRLLREQPDLQAKLGISVQPDGAAQSPGQLLPIK